jgi:hypothetical protein
MVLNFNFKHKSIFITIIFLSIIIVSGVSSRYLAAKYERKIVFYQQKEEPFEQPIDPDMTSNRSSDVSTESGDSDHSSIVVPMPDHSVRPKPEEVQAVVSCGYECWNNMSRPIERNLTDCWCRCLAERHQSIQVINELYCFENSIDILPTSDTILPPGSPGRQPGQLPVNSENPPMIPEPTNNKEASRKFLRSVHLNNSKA